MFKINPDAKHSFGHIGHEKTPIFVIDDLIENITDLSLTASKSIMSESHLSTGYPGKRSDINAAYKKTIMDYIYPIMLDVYKIPTSLSVNSDNACFSSLSKPENKLSPFQCIPHLDSTNRFYFAVMHYINEGDFGGTGFYRHSPTGYENITEKNVSNYELSVQNYLDTNGYPEQRYFKESDDHFELIAKMDYRPNRLIIYPGTLLHSAYVTPEVDIINDINKSRLTANIFASFA